VTEHPEDEPRNEPDEPAAPAEADVNEPRAPEPEAAVEPPPQADPAAEAPTETATEPAGEPEPADQPAAETPGEQPAETPEEQPAGEPPAPAQEPAGEAAATTAPEPPAVPTGSAPQAGTESAETSEEEELELTPRQKPEIPGADLEPDIVPDIGQFLDAEAQAEAEAEAEAAAARAREESEDGEAQPIADAAIDLAAGARYTATGKRKTAVARVILKPGTGTYSINDKPLEMFFPRETLQRMIRQPLETVGYASRMDVVARMHGGGVSAQAGALRHGVSRALIEADPNLRGELKRRGFLTRDPRVKERKKAGLKKARKRPQFSKR
jgi:small subunit ribosomal protein S9